MNEVMVDRVGYAYVSGNGQLVIDAHASDEEHLRSPATRETQPLYDCRVYLKDVFPGGWLNRPGRFTVQQVRGPGEQQVVLPTDVVARQHVAQNQRYRFVLLRHNGGR